MLCQIKNLQWFSSYKICIIKESFLKKTSFDTKFMLDYARKGQKSPVGLVPTRDRATKV